jgi:CopG family transcriptional regulator/antitoxin EndoAI
MKKTAHRRINITLPEETVEILSTMADKGSRSTFIDTAIRTYAKSLQQKSLRERVKEGAIARAEQNLKMAQEWFDLEEELWRD